MVFSGAGQTAFADTKPKEPASPVRIGLIDTGVSARFFEEGKIIEGKNYAFPEKNTEDTIGHGTRIASLILGFEKYGQAYKGANPDAALVPMVYMASSPYGVTVNSGVPGIAKAIRDAVDIYGCKVLIISSGVIHNDKELEAAVNYAEGRGVTLISAVGNDNLKKPENVFYPAAYNAVVGVGSSKDGAVSSFSQRNNVFVCAPGEGLKALSRKGRVETVSGTSYAAALVAAAAAKLYAAQPDITPARVRELLRQSADPKGGAYDDGLGWGIFLLESLESLSLRM
jgi:subtilisin family serine protease